MTCIKKCKDAFLRTIISDSKRKLVKAFDITMYVINQSN